ncbi:MAG: hypothetical protein V4555_11490 [Acidobacteriota bacterium]
MNSTMHLTDDQIDEYLMGDLSAEATAHLDACNPCLTRVAEVEQPLASFRAVSLAWSERRSATLPLQEFAPVRPRWTRRFVWGATAAAALVIGIVVPTLHAPAATETNVAVAAVAPAPVAPVVQVAHISREEQIARDNQMLQAIDRELNASVESPAALGLPVDGRSRGHNRSTMQD